MPNEQGVRPYDAKSMIEATRERQRLLAQEVLGKMREEGIIVLQPEDVEAFLHLPELNGDTSAITRMKIQNDGSEQPVDRRRELMDLFESLPPGTVSVSTDPGERTALLFWKASDNSLRRLNLSEQALKDLKTRPTDLLESLQNTAGLNVLTPDPGSVLRRDFSSTKPLTTQDFLQFADNATRQIYIPRAAKERAAEDKKSFEETGL